MPRTSKQREAKASTAERTRARAVEATKAAQRPVPKAPAGLKAAGREAWTRTWKTCPWLNESHAGVVRRLAEDYDLHAEVKAELKKTGFTSIGSQGQPVQSPLFGTLQSVEVSINRSERQLGISVNASRAATVADDVLAEQARNKTGTRLSEVAK